MKSPKASQLFFVTRTSNGTSLSRPATAEERKRAKAGHDYVSVLRARMIQLQKELDRTVRRCKHTVVYETSGRDYGVMTCYACGKHFFVEGRLRKACGRSVKG